MVSSPSPDVTLLAKPSQPNCPRVTNNTDSDGYLDETRTQSEDPSQTYHRQRRSVFQDVTIPTNILRYVKTDKQWTPETAPEVVGIEALHQADSPSNFNVFGIALEQQAAIDNAFGNASASQARRSSRTERFSNHGQAVDRQQTSLPALDEEKEDEVHRLRRRWTSGMHTTRETPRRSVDIRRGQKKVSAGPETDGTVLFRSLESYTLQGANGVNLRRYSSAVAPDADFLATYNGSLEKDIDQRGFDNLQHTTKEEVEQPSNSSAMRRASMAVASLYQTVRRGTVNLARRNTLHDLYENAKIRGKHLQRKKWAQIVFEYTFYLILASFVYFVLIGLPLWKGAVWWLYWLVRTKFTVEGTWSITIGLAVM
jgi:hypothetical protein